MAMSAAAASAAARATSGRTVVLVSEVMAREKVAEQVLDDLNVYAGGEVVGGGEVPEVVQPDGG